jgi:hypothetical protein
MRALAAGEEDIEPARRKLLQGLPLKHMTVTIAPMVCAECGADEDVGLHLTNDEDGATRKTPLCDACWDGLQ